MSFVSIRLMYLFINLLHSDISPLSLQGCYSAVVGWFEMHGYIMVAVACAIIILQVSTPSKSVH